MSEAIESVARVRDSRSALSRRLLASAAGAALGGCLAALADALWTRSREAEPPPLASTWLSTWGLDAPAALIFGLVVGGAAIFLHADSPGPRGLLAYLSRGTAKVRAERALRFAAGAVAVPLWLFALARLALPVLSSEQPAKSSGILLGLAGVLLALGLHALTLGVARGLARHAAKLAPHWIALLGLVLALALFGFAVATGSTGGDGGTLAMFGVLKRAELDLRAPGLLLLIAVFAYLAQALLERRRPLLLLAAALIPLLATVYAATAGLNARKTAIAVERSAGMAKLLLGPMRKLGDRDRDGASRWFGGNDCDDRHPGIYPGADDIPGNGLDEDCSGQDDTAVVLAAPAAEPPKDAKAYIAEKLPKDLSVVLITIDTLRYDLGYAGNPRKLSPNLDALAKRSVVFEKAYALASYTGKSVGPTLIGKYTSETDRGWSHFNRFGKGETFVQERLKQAGVRTISVQGHWYFKEDTGIGRGFDVLDLSAAPKQLQMEGDRTINSDKLSDAAIQQLSEPANTSRRFYMWVHYLDPHAEYVKHDEFDFGSKSRDLYDGEVAFVDKHVGRLLDFIQKSPMADRTAVIVSADHGEAFGEHGLIRHGFELWEELVRVPLIVYVPGAPAHVVKERRSLVDLVPTLLDLYRAPRPSGTGLDFISGQSLVSDIFMPPGYQPAPRIVFVDMSAGPNNAERQAFIEKDLKLVASGGRPLSLYDLAADPDEKKDLLDDEAKSEAVLPRFKAFRRELKEVRVKPIPK